MLQMDIEMVLLMLEMKMFLLMFVMALHITLFIFPPLYSYLISSNLTKTRPL